MDYTLVTFEPTVTAFASIAEVRPRTQAHTLALLMGTAVSTTPSLGHRSRMAPV